MKKLFAALKVGGKIGFGVILLIIAMCALSWIITCGIVYVITLCFGWTFTWAIATGIWFIMCLVRAAFHNNVTVRK